jgi:hypothetical protein
LRPRISQKEAAYVVSILKAQLENLKKQRANPEELEWNMDRIIYDLSHRVQEIGPRIGPYSYLTKKHTSTEYRIVGDREALDLMHIYKELKAEHPKIRIEILKLFDHLATHDRLIKKYSAIANGEPHDGRYKKMSMVYCLIPKIAEQENGTTNT